MSAFEKITAQQQGKEHTPVWMVGQQLKDMLQDDPTLEEILDKDLDVKGMALADCAAKIKAFADEYHRKIKGNCICIPPDIAEGIIREFYGLPGICEVQDPAPEPVREEEEALDFSDFL